MKAENITEYFAQDHNRLDEFFDRFQALKGSNLPDAAANFRQFSDGLLQHIAWEEQILFPAFEERTGMRDSGPTAVMRMEHKQIRSLLDAIGLELRQGRSATESEEAQLRGVLGAHNVKEERVLYPAIDRMLTEPERADVFARMQLPS
ncbi:MAG: hemerythrin domain-containing protein [Deltaproteobacteria bacterium]|nr:hemerythrin domain-containing protein [Deltaproteobacteria bacterium]